MATGAPVRGAAVAVPGVAAVQGVVGAAGAAGLLVGRTVAAAVRFAGGGVVVVVAVVARFLILLLEELRHVCFPLLLPRAGSLVGRAVAVFGMVRLAGGVAAVGLLLAAGWLVGFWWVDRLGRRAVHLRSVL